MIGDIDPLERESFEPEPEEPERQSQATWGPWEAWIQCRIEAALVEERAAVAEIMAHALADLRAMLLGRLPMLPPPRKGA